MPFYVITNADKARVMLAAHPTINRAWVGVLERVLGSEVTTALLTK